MTRVRRKGCDRIGIGSMVVIAGIVVLAGGSRGDAQTIPADAVPSCIVAPAQFQSWFATGVIPNGIVKPANSVTFAGNNNCSFYQWSEQMFLWLTSPAPPEYGGTDRIFDSPTFFDVSAPDPTTGERSFIRHVPGSPLQLTPRLAQRGAHDLPVVMTKAGKLFEVAPPVLAPSGKQVVVNSAGARVEIDRVVKQNGKLVFLDATGHAVVGVRPALHAAMAQGNVLQKVVVDGGVVFVDALGVPAEIEQGQADGSVLMSQNRSLVYYATMVNDVYAYFLTGVKVGAIGPGTQFPTTQPELNQILAFAAPFARIPDPEALAIEIKTSWVDVKSLANPGDYLTMSAMVPIYDQSDPSLWVPTGSKPVTLALVGVHVVGSAANHPEMIWATFEHFNNSPSQSYTYNSTSGPRPSPPDPSVAWLFNSGKPTSVNQATMVMSGVDIAGLGANPFTPSDTLRINAWGAAQNAPPNPGVPSPAASNSELISINHSVLTQIPPGDVRARYFMLGSTWTNGRPPTGSFPQGNVVGTSQLSNSTLETYVQGSGAYDAFLGCFGCHTLGGQPLPMVQLSHVFEQLQPLQPF